MIVGLVKRVQYIELVVKKGRLELWNVDGRCCS